jgi:indolepyruvate ferredoxin oxidoreductase
MKTIQEIVESSSATAMIDPDRVKIVLPEDFAMPPGGLHIRWPDRAGAGSAPVGLQVVRRPGLHPRQQAQLQRDRRPERPLRHHRQRQGLQRHAPGAGGPGAGRRHLPQLGIRLHKVGVVWPLEATITREFATGLQEILVVEEKRQVIEYQLKEELYNWRADVRPNVLGKFDECAKATSRAANGPCPTPANTGCCAPRPTCRPPSSPRPLPSG